MNTILEMLGGKKFSWALLCLILSTVLLILGKVDQDIWETVLIFLTSAMILGHTATDIAIIAKGGAKKKE